MNVHESILERWESKKFFGFNHFTQNTHYSAIFTQILGIIVQATGQNTQSIISLTGMQKLDHLLNRIKVKALECLNYSYKYLFELVPNSVKAESPFLPRGIQLTPFLVSSLIDIAQRQNIEDLIEDETY